MSTITDLKEALVDELVDQVTNGATAVDKETGEIVKLSTPSAILSVAAKVVKDFSDELETETTTEQQQSNLQSYLNRHRNLKVVPD